MIEKIRQKLYISDIPSLLNEYSAKNILPADQVIAGTGKKLWWKCSDPKCGYEWAAVGCSRVRGIGCPACAHNIVTPKNNLTVTHPELAKEYSAKNILPADQVMAGTHRKFWWKCNKCNHEWAATGNSRAYSKVKGGNCPNRKKHK